MQNPILQAIKGNRPQNQTINRLQELKSLMSSKNPNDVYNYLMQSDPRFKQFINDTKGKSLEDIALDYDIDVNLVKQFM